MRLALFTTAFAAALFLIPATAAPANSPEVRTIANGAALDRGGMHVKLEFTAPGTVRVMKWTDGGSDKKRSLSVVQSASAKLAIKTAQTESAVTLDSGTLKVVLNTADGTIRFVAPDGHTLLQEQGPAQFSPTGLKQEPKAFSIRQDFKLAAGEGIYGFGQSQDGVFNWRDHSAKIVQANTAAVTPVLVSTNGYGIFWDNYSKTLWNDDAKGASLWSEVADNVDYYFFAGPTIDDAIVRYRQLTGAAPMYGKWAYGYWQSKEHYHTQKELLDVARKYRDLQIPIDGIIQDWNYWDGLQNWGSTVWDATRYPDPKAMYDELHSLNFHAMTVIWEALGPASDIHKEMDKRGWLYSPVGWAGFKYYDAYNPAANDLFWEYVRKNIFSKGNDAWWMDSTEPDIVNALTKDAHEYEMKKVEDNAIGSFARYLNPYSLVVTESVYKNQRKDTDKKRVFILTRSTFAGQQRAAAATWSGDIGADWGVYAAQIPAGINHSMSGIPYWTFDIGAFSLGCQGGVFANGGKDPAYQELYTRMFQFGTFAPIFRSHGSETPREIWEFGEHTPTLIKFDTLRYRLMPYIYSQAWQVTHNGASIMRGLPMDFPNDPAARDVGDQFLFGPSLMAAPVTTPMYHRPPEASVLATGPSLFHTPDGKKEGLKATYFCDEKWEKVCHEAVEPAVDLYWYTGWPEFIKGPKFSMRWEGKLTVPVSGTYRFDLKSFGPKKIYLDGKEVAHNYDSMGSWTIPLQLEAGKTYDFKFETNNAVLGAFRAQVYWKTPAAHARDAAPLTVKDKTREVYLPSGTGWFDFWTGKAMNGGQKVSAAADITTMPLMVRAGSIVPMGPVVQYATQKPADTIELRVYPGANGNFVLYEDENDTYAYEKGIYATIAFHWNDAKRTLTIDPRKGKFPGMLAKRTFKIVIVGDGHGAGIDDTARPDKTVIYDGRKTVVALTR
ncbi:TIM-barrel domain-containing protein [Rhizomicrobium electricum]|uniref:PA14 domain-containing protein n=1 Tax=Rhizomicrobium electricum TaxID=480070 RepID=A0ABP3PUR2_9PROT|nr:TIM-barrel domain-containing protein [Rhizomicrobium electricum]NIJ48913.1 alpha-D-xyloside xylohydrolase [Rhizomicrobium electricum]